MASTARFVIERAMKNHTAFNITAAQANMTAAERNNATGLLIMKLVFAESKSVRTSTIILAVFNVLAAFATAASILYDSYSASKRCNPKFKTSKFCVRMIHPAETFPLLLAIGIVIQGLVFTAVQGQGLQSLFIPGCTVISQYMWPALFIVPYIQVVFGLECAIRSLRSQPFQARGKHDVIICGGVIVLMLAGTWIPSHLDPQRDTCFASLMWFITHFGRLGVILLSTAGGLMILSASIIFYRLSTVTLIDEHQRIAASRMVYYLVLGLISLGFVLPWFISLITGDGPDGASGGDLKAAMMATVVVNLSGLISGLLQLFLRANTATTSFGPKSARDRKKHEIRIWGPNELAFNNHLMDPVSGPRTPQAELEVRSESRTNLVAAEKARVASMESLGSPTYQPPTRYNNSPLVSDSVELKDYESGYGSAVPATRTHTRKQSYSLFPGDQTSPVKSPPKTTRQEPTSIYDISDITPPPPVWGTRGLGHKRDSSIASSATVQIGLRISHAPPSPEDTSNLPLPLPSTTYKPNTTQQRPQPSPLKLQTTNIQPTPASPQRPSPVATNTKSPTLSPTFLASVNKTLPPTPKTNIVSRLNGPNTLSPAVYSPEKKTVSTPKSAINPLRGNPLSSPSQSKRPTQSNQTGGKSDWI